LPSTFSCRSGSPLLLSPSDRYASHSLIASYY
jgi:hypothetical protein